MYSEINAQNETGLRPAKKNREASSDSENINRNDLTKHLRVLSPSK